MPPPTATSTSPARIAASRMPAARTPEAQTLLIVSEETSFGMPGLDLRLARGDLPLAGLEDLAHHDVLDLVRLDVGALERGLDRDAAELGGVERDEAAAELADGVRAAPRMTVVGHAPSTLSTSGALAMDVRATTDARRSHRRRHDRGRRLRGRGRRPRRRRRAAAARCSIAARPAPASAARARARRGAPLDRRRARHARGVRRRARQDRRRRAYSAARASSARARCAGSSRTTLDDAHAAALVEGTCWAATVHDAQARRRRGGRRRARAS